MISVDKLIDGLTLFVEREMIPALSGAYLWGAGAALALAVKRAEQLAPIILESPVLAKLGVVGEDGRIDAEAALDALQTAAKKHGKITVDIPVFGQFIFADKDVAVLRGYILGDGSEG